MKSLLFLLAILCLAQPLFAQNVYTIKADSVKLTGRSLKGRWSGSMLYNIQQEQKIDNLNKKVEMMIEKMQLMEKQIAK